MPEITALPNATALTGNEVYPIVQSGETRQAPVSPYRVYTAILSQSGTDAPIATVLRNTLGGTVVWSYDGAGSYVATLAGAFTDEKTWLIASPVIALGGVPPLFFHTLGNEDICNLITAADGWELMSVKIEVYP